jgi:hypothetical protein
VTGRGFAPGTAGERSEALSRADVKRGRKS